MGPTRLSDRLLVWGPEDIEEEALAQAHRTAKMPFIHGHVALMPDAHWGLGATVGSVIPTQGAIIPAAVGVDIGCGMIAVETSLTVSDLPDDLSRLLSRIERAVPSGVGKGHSDRKGAGGRGGRISGKRERRMKDLGVPGGTILTGKQLDTAADQLGTLGSGNHFLEVCTDPNGAVWVVLHSGSRGIGNQLAQHHIDTAKGLMKRHLVDLPDPDLAYIVENTPEFDAYIDDLMWAQGYALANREQMMDAALDVVRSDVSGGRYEDEPARLEKRRINCHHNYTVREHHFGADVWVTRKGAIRARRGDWGVIPGSMGTHSFIVRGLGSSAGLMSSSHGAGRKMSRRRAQKDLTVQSLQEAMRGKAWLADRSEALLDEHPDAYKSIERVMAAQADLAEIETELTQVLNYKGT